MSTLEMMAASIVGEKKARASKLTPTKAEAATMPPPAAIVTAAPFPYDKLDLFEAAIGEVERQLAFLREGLGLIRATEPPAPAAGAYDHLGKASPSAPEPKPTEFEEQFAAKAAAAQAATFAPSTKVPAEDSTVGGWTCPKHARSIEKTSRLGRTYRKCPDCDEFERI